VKLAENEDGFTAKLRLLGFYQASESQWGNEVCLSSKERRISLLFCTNSANRTDIPNKLGKHKQYLNRGIHSPGKRFRYLKYVYKHANMVTAICSEFT